MQQRDAQELASSMMPRRPPIAPRMVTSTPSTMQIQLALQHTAQGCQHPAKVIVRGMRLAAAHLLTGLHYRLIWRTMLLL